jgi:uncharacterized protein YukE
MSTPTPLITPIPGDPEQVRRVSAQLATVETCAREIESRLRAIETGVGPQMWRGQAADGFAALLAETGPDLTRLAASYGAASQALATYATELATAQDAARAAAAEANTATGDRDQATADRDSAEADAARHAAAADEARLRLDPIAAQDADQRRGDSIGRASAAGAAIDQAERALRAARQKADEAAGQRDTAAARCIRELDAASRAGIDPRSLVQGLTTPAGPSSPTPYGAVAGEILGDVSKNVTDDLRDKWPLHASDLVTGAVAGGLAAKHVSALTEESRRLMLESDRANQRYLNSSGGPAERAFHNAEAQRKFMAADELKREADRVGRRVSAKIGLAGLGISGVGVAYDVFQGKSLVKAAVSGVGGTVAAGLTGARIGALVGTFAGGPVGTAAGAVLGWGAGLAVSAIADWGYDQLPKGLKDSIENGTRPVEDAIRGTGKAMLDGVAKAWDVIF